jgi:hypothetical protein
MAAKKFILHNYANVCRQFENFDEKEIYLEEIPEIMILMCSITYF